MLPRMSLIRGSSKDHDTESMYSQHHQGQLGHVFQGHHLHLPHQLKDVEVFARAISYLMYFTFPLHAAMIGVGFVHKDDCPVDVRVPRYLFFGGLAGLMAVLLRLVMVTKWKMITRKHKNIT